MATPSSSSPGIAHRVKPSVLAVAVLALAGYVARRLRHRSAGKPPDDEPAPGTLTDDGQSAVPSSGEGEASEAIVDPLSINGPLLVARAQARLDSEEARGDAMLGQLAAVSGAAGFVLTIGGTVLITVQPRDLPLQHRLLGVHLGFHLGTVLALVFGVLGFGALILVMTGLQALKDPRYRSRTPQLRIGGFVGQLSSRSSDVVREQLTEMALQEPEVLLANHRRALLVGRMGALFVAGFVSIVLFTTIMLFGSAKPAEVKIISGSPPATTTNTATTTTNSP